MIQLTKRQSLNILFKSEADQLQLFMWHVGKTKGFLGNGELGHSLRTFPDYKPFCCHNFDSGHLCGRGCVGPERMRACRWTS